MRPGAGLLLRVRNGQTRISDLLIQIGEFILGGRSLRGSLRQCDFRLLGLFQHLPEASRRVLKILKMGRNAFACMFGAVNRIIHLALNG